MSKRERISIASLFFGGLILQVVFHCWFGLDFRAPRFATIAVGVIGLRWGAVWGAYLGAFGGLILALVSGEPPFAATAAMAGAGWLAGEVPSHVIVETYRAVTLIAVAAALLEFVLFSLFRGILPPGGLRPAVWATGWVVAFAPLFYWLVERYNPGSASMSRLPAEPE